jgi:hypothetical protein
MITVATKKKIEKYTDKGRGKYLYKNNDDKEDIRNRVRVVLLAIAKSECNAVVLSALGCGLQGHPPEAVAMMFKSEIYRIGTKLPAVYFAILDDNTSEDGNFKVFRRILQEPGDGTKWQPSRDAWFYQIMGLCEEDFPQIKRDAEGSGASSTSKPKGKDKTKPQLPDDVPMGVPSSEGAGGSKTASVGSSSGQATYHPAESGSGLAGSFASSNVLPETPGSVLSRSESHGLVNLVIFPRNPSATLMLRHDRPQEERIYDIAGATCIDAAAQQLLFCYVLKLNDIVKWRESWDEQNLEIWTHRAVNKGQVRDGPGHCGSYTYGDAPQPYLPNGPMQDAEVQAAELLDFAIKECGMPSSLWRNVSDVGQAARAKDNITMAGDVRRTLLLKVVRAMYDKPKCSFANPLELYREDDVYYFPDGAAFTTQQKPTAFMAASILAINPASKMDEKSRTRGREYVTRGFAIADGPSHGASAAASTAVVMQRPAGVGLAKGKGKGKSAKK